jgi:hypothetical protein
MRDPSPAGRNRELAHGSRWSSSHLAELTIGRLGQTGEPGPAHLPAGAAQCPICAASAITRSRHLKVQIGSGAHANADASHGA